MDDGIRNLRSKVSAIQIQCVQPQCIISDLIPTSSIKIVFTVSNGDILSVSIDQIDSNSIGPAVVDEVPKLSGRLQLSGDSLIVIVCVSERDRHGARGSDNEGHIGSDLYCHAVPSINFWQLFPRHSGCSSV